MRKLSKALAIVLSIALVCVFAAGCGQQKSEPSQQPEGSGAAEPMKIGIIQYTEHVALDSAREGFLEALEENGYKDGENVTIDFQNAQNDPSNLATISKSFVSKNVDLVLGIATPAVQSIAGETEEIPWWARR